MSIDTASIIISAVSLLTGIGISGIAIWLSIYFYTKSKDVQTDTSNSLTKIDTQIAQLNSINDKLLSRALASLSQIAKKKVTAESIAVSEQATAALLAVATIPERLAAFTEKQIAQQAGAASQGNEISGHNLPYISEPFTLAELKREYIHIVSHFFNLVGWVNNYGQQALIAFTGAGADGGLIKETGDNLNHSADFYRNAKQTLNLLLAAQPDLFANHPATANVEATITRLDTLIRNYDETVAYYFPDDSTATP